MDFIEWWATRDWVETRNWGVAIGGLIALGFAAATYTLNSRTKRTEQASRVYAYKSAEYLVSKGDYMEVPRSSDVDKIVRIRIENGALRHLAEEPHVRYEWTIVNGSDQLIGPVFLTCEFKRMDGSLVKRSLRQRLVAPGSKATLEFLIRDGNS